MSGINKKLFVFFIGIPSCLAMLLMVDAYTQMRRAESAFANYKKWANSPDGVEARRLQRDLDRQRRNDSINCYLNNLGPDYDVSLDCPENLKPRLKLTPPEAWVYPSVWYYSLPKRFFGSDTSKAIHEIHMEAIEYWEPRGPH